MSKIRINELARQLEIPSHVIVEMLPEVGVTEKKTHSSSIDEPVAELLRKRLHGEPAAQPESGGAATAVAEPEHIAEPPAAHVPAPEQERSAPAAKSAPVHTGEPAAPASDNGSSAVIPEEPLRSKPAPVRPPLATGPSAPLHPPLRTGTIPARPVPSAPRPGQILSGPRQPLPSGIVPPAAPAQPAPPSTARASAPPAVEAPGPSPSM